MTSIELDGCARGRSALRNAAEPPRSASVPLHAARRERAREGFAPYAGPRLSGPRCVLEYGQPGYPAQLASIKHPPKRLYVIGEPAVLEDGLAIVGARMATPYGLACAETFASRAASAGICVVSGGARGCDARAHRAAMEAGGKTVVILGGGCDELYPAEHFSLFQRAIDCGGAVISEQEWSFPPLRFAFRARNRLIAGLTRATLIVEAGMPSGTFSTADEALAAGRDVLVVPGAITSKTSRGCNRLLLQGALPVVDDESFDDALFALFGALRQDCRTGQADPPAKKLSKAERRLLAALQASPSTLERLTELAVSGELGMSVPRMSTALATLQCSQAIARYPDGRYGPRTLDETPAAP